MFRSFFRRIFLELMQSIFNEIRKKVEQRGYVEENMELLRKENMKKEKKEYNLSLQKYNYLY